MRVKHLFFVALGVWILAMSWATITSDATVRAVAPASTQNTVVFSPSPTRTTTPTMSPACGLAWRSVQGVTPGQSSFLHGVEALAANDVWAVGWASTVGYAQTLIQRWNGSAWTQVPSPNIEGQPNFLYDVSFVSATDGWAVGFTAPVGGVPRETLTMHWNGTDWQIVPSPNATSDTSILRDVWAVSSDDVWAVGYSGMNGQFRSLVLHWDGSQWGLVTVPQIGTGENLLYGVTALSASDVWAVGTYYNTVNNLYQTLTLHWNGNAWAHIASPNNSGYNELRGVSALSATEVWAVGGYPGAALTMRWDGSAWTLHAAPGDNWLEDVIVRSSTDVWAVGQGTSPVGSHLLHWDGAVWSQVPNISGGYLRGVWAVAANDAWAVGERNNTAFIEHYSDPCVGATLTPTGTATPAISTATNTPTATAPVLQATMTPTLGATNVPTNSPTWPPLPPPPTTPPAQVTSTRTATAQPSPTATSMPPVQCDLAWRAVPNPLGGTLLGVEAIARDDVWAVGDNGAMHWDGVGWTVVPVPVTDTLRAVSAVATDDVWIAASETLIHWNGSAWSQYTVPEGGLINDVDAYTTNDVWAVGTIPSGSITFFQTYIAHWDGVSWSRIPSENPYTRINYLYSVSVITQDRAWAVGFGAGNGPIDGLIVMGWDGNQWSFVEYLYSAHDNLFDVDGMDTGDIWAVGNRWNPNDTLVTHYDGSSWRLVKAPRVDSLRGVSVLAANDVWAVGRGGIVHWDGLEWTRAPAPQIPLNGVDAFAPDDVWAVGDGLLHYSRTLYADVSPSHTFYDYVQSLGCRGIVSGYSDGTFRPGNAITRGQISKIVSNAAGFSEPVTGQSFQDVPPTDTFYEWIERLYRRGHIGGYACGSVPQEPCVAPENRPYFRPNANATRGQLSKIVANAAGLSTQPQGQFYADVPIGHTFYLEIMRLTQRGVMSGYPCGGPGEPCDGQNRPYFRPGSNVTRGQTAKIVANTFFP